MRRFLRHLLSFCALPALVLLLGEAVLEWSGELWPIERVLAYQRAHPDALFLRATDQVFYAYKYRGIVERRPAILVAGSSRTMKFRAEMFGDRARDFYNAGGILNSMRDAHDLAMALPASRTPDVLLLGVDLWWLNDRVAPAYAFQTEISKRTGVDEHIVALRWLITQPRSFAAEALSIAGGGSAAAIGISARERGGGFRADGSFKSRVPAPRTEREWRFVDRESPPIVDRVASATANFPPADRVSPERLALLDSALARLRQRHVAVVGYLPPFASEVVARLSTDPRHSRFWADFRRLMPEVFRRHGFPMIDASEPSAFGMDDRAMSDGEHAEETFHLHVLKALLGDDRLREILPGARTVLERAIASPRTNYWEPDLGS